MSAHGVIVAVRGPHEAAIASAIDAHPALRVARRCADLAEALAAASAGVARTVVLSDQPQLTRAMLADLRAHGVTVIGLPGSEAAREALLTLGAAIVAPVDADPTTVATVVAGAPATGPVVAPDPVPAAAENGRIVAVWGPTGAPGRTTVAVNVAAELAARDHATILVDADTYGGAVAQCFGVLDESAGLAAIARAADRGASDQSVVNAYASRVAPSLRIVTGIARPSRWTELPRAALDQVWVDMRSAAAWTVIDTGFCLETDEELSYDTHAPQRNAATLSALEAADHVIAVGSAEPLAMQRLIHGLTMLDDLGIASTLVVVNRVRSDVAGPRPDEAVADALTRFAGVARTWTVPWDPRACDAAVMSGQSLAERAPRSRVRRAIAHLAARLEEEAARPGASSPSPVTAVAH